MNLQEVPLFVTYYWTLFWIGTSFAVLSVFGSLFMIYYGFKFHPRPTIVKFAIHQAYNDLAYSIFIVLASLNTEWLCTASNLIVIVARNGSALFAFMMCQYFHHRLRMDLANFEAKTTFYCRGLYIISFLAGCGAYFVNSEQYEVGCGFVYGASNLLALILDYWIVLLSTFGVIVFYFRVFCLITANKMDISKRSFIFIPAVMVGVWTVAFLDDLFILMQEDFLMLTFIRTALTRGIGLFNFLLYGKNMYSVLKKIKYGLLTSYPEKLRESKQDINTI